ncbi:MAG: NUDIX hydrolase, partial [Patescibacteria group bacterium]
FLCLYRLKRPVGLSLLTGHIDKGETPEQAVKREVLEESGIMADTVNLIWSGFIENECSRKDTDGFYYNCHQWWIFEITEWRGEPENKEPNKHKLVEFMPLNEIKKYKNMPIFDPAWIRILKALRIF